MVLVTYIILLVHLKVALANGLSISEKECNINYPAEVKWDEELKYDLNCNYDVFMPPKTDSKNPLTVTVKFMLNYFTLSDSGNLQMQNIMTISWKDERLKWDPNKYGGLTETIIHSTSIWTPSYRVFNNLDSDDVDRFFYQACKLKSNGLVFCMPHEVYEAPCDIKLSDFPYDAQECSLEFGTLGTNNGNIKMNYSSQAISMWKASYGSQWVITGYKQRSEQEKQLIMSFVFEREAESLAAVIVYPSLIISFISVACLFLDVRNNVRLMFACFNIFSHYFWLVELVMYIPKASADPPRLLLYCRGSMILAVLGLVTTFMLNIICKKKTVPYYIVNSIVGFLKRSYVHFLVFPRWSVDEQVDGDENNVFWTVFANSLNTVFIIVFICTYIAMYCVWMPQPIPFN